MLRIAVCDDESDCLHNTVIMLNQWSNEADVPIMIEEFNDGDSLISRNMAVHYNIIFLDIMMPLLNGIDTARELRDEDSVVRIIFLTSSPEFALASYSVKAQGYIIKPGAYEQVKEIMENCVNAFYSEPENIVVKTVLGYKKIYYHDIEYFEAQNKRVVLYLRNNSRVEIPEPLRVFEERLIEETRFYKCHRSYLVYMPNVEHFTQTEAVTKTGKNIPIARGCGKTFQEAYFSAMFAGR